MDDVLVVGGGPAGLLSAWLARQGGAKVRVVAAGIGSTHIMPGWLGIANAAAEEGAQGDDLPAGIAALAGEHPGHPYAVAGLDALRAGIVALQEICEASGLRYRGGLERNMRLPTALGAALPAAYAPESFVAGDLNGGGAMLIAGPAGWRDFHPALIAGNLARQGFAAEPFAFDLPEIHAVKFDNLGTGLARLFDRPDVRERVGKQIAAHLNGAARVGLPAVLGLDAYPAAWQHLQELIGVPVFEIPTLPPSVPGIRLFNAFKGALTRARVPLLFNMPVARGLVDGRRVTGIAVTNVVRETIYRGQHLILATGGLYGGGITSDPAGALSEVVLGLPVHFSQPFAAWFGQVLLGTDHPIHQAGILVNREMQPVDRAGGEPLYDNVRVAGRLVAGYNGVSEGSTEGAWLATAARAVSSLLA